MHEIHDEFGHGDKNEAAGARGKSTFVQVLLQIAVLDIVFSLDSVISAGGMV